MVTEIIAQPLEPSSSKKHGLLVITTPVSPNAVQKGNQGTAIVARKLTSFPSAYSSAPSGQPSSCNIAYFRCAPRKLSLMGDGRVRLEIKVFERHPYTRQAFFPMGRLAEQRSYVVVVAEDNDGKPDLNSVYAFVAMGNQGIVYEQNLWHSPMCAIHETAEFAVVQNENGIPEEDTVEYFLDDHERVDVILPKSQPRSRM